MNRHNLLSVHMSFCIFGVLTASFSLTGWEIAYIHTYRNFRFIGGAGKALANTRENVSGRVQLAIS